MPAVEHKFPYERRHRLSEAPPADKTNKFVIEMLEEALVAAKAGYMTTALVALLEPGDVLTIFRDNSLPIYESLGLVEYIRKEVSEDVGVMQTFDGGVA